MRMPPSETGVDLVKTRTCGSGGELRHQHIDIAADDLLQGDTAVEFRAEGAERHSPSGT
jgi:hypothetical protein